MKHLTTTLLILLTILISDRSGAAYAQSCNLSLAPRLSEGDHGVVTPGKANNVRNRPTTAGALIGQIPAGGQFVVLGGPECANGYFWVEINYNGLIGWTVESGNGEYWLEPINSPTDVEAISCSVTTLQGVNLRTGPGRDFEQTGSRPTGNTFEVDAQAQDAEGYTWWRVADGSIDDGLWVRSDLVSERGQCSSLQGPEEADTLVDHTEANVVPVETVVTTQEASDPETEATAVTVAMPVTTLVAADETAFYQDDFSANTVSWGVGNLNDNPDASVTIRDGSLNLMLGEDYQDGSGIIVGPGEPEWSLAPQFNEPFEARFLLNGGICDSFSGNECEILILFGLQRDYRDYYLVRYSQNRGIIYLERGRQQVTLAGIPDDQAPNLFDGQPHTLTLKVDTDYFQVLIDEQKWLETRNVNLELGGTIGIGVSRGRTLGYYDVGIRLEELAVLPFTDPADVPSTILIRDDQFVESYALDFEQNSANGWLVERGNGYESSVTQDLYTLVLDDRATDDRGPYSNFYDVSFASFDAAPYFNSPYLYEVRVAEVVGERTDRVCVRLLFDVQPNLTAYEVFQYCNTFGTGQSINQGRVLAGSYRQNDGEVNGLPVSPQLAQFDQPRVLAVRREEGRATFLVDGREMFSVPIEAPIGGTIGLGVGDNSFYNDDTTVVRVARVSVTPVEARTIASFSPYSEEQRVTLMESPDTLLFEDFGDASRWTGDGEVHNGVLNLRASRFSSSLMDKSVYIDYPFEIEYEVTAVDGSEDFYTSLLFNSNEFRISNLFGTSTESALIEFQLQRNRYGYAIRDTVFGGTLDYYALPAGIDLADGSTHRVKWRVAQPFGQNIVVTLFINDEQAAEYVISTQVINDVYVPFVTTIAGDVGLYAGTLSSDTAVLQFDNLILKRYVADALAANTGLGQPTVEFQSEIPRLQLRYPEGWVEAPRANALDPDAGYAESHTITMTNSPQGFTGGPNEIGFSLYDGALVTTYSQIPDTRSVALDTVLETFTRLADGDRQGGQGDDVWALATVENTVLPDGRDVSIATGEAPGADFAYLAFRSSDNRVTVMEFLTSRGQLDEFLPLILDIAATVDYPAPSQDYGPSERALLAHLTSAYELQFFDSTLQTCLGDIVLTQGFGLLMENATGTESRGFNPVSNFRDVDFIVDTRGLFLEVIPDNDNNDAVNIIRVTGVVERLYNDGSSDKVPHELYFIAGYEQYFGTAAFRMENTGGRWVRCSGLVR